MGYIKVVYDDGNNGLVKLVRAQRTNNRKKPYEMSTQEIMATGCEIFPK